VGLVGSFVGGWQTITSPNGIDGTILQGLNNLGVVVGSYNDVNGISRGFVATPVPEPQTFAMLLAGLGAVLVAVRQRRAVTAAP